MLSVCWEHPTTSIKYRLIWGQLHAKSCFDYSKGVYTPKILFLAQWARSPVINITCTQSEPSTSFTDRSFSWPLVRGCGKFRSPAYLILIKGKVKCVVQIWYHFSMSILNDIKYFTLLTLYSMLVMGDFKRGKCMCILLLTWVKGKARYGRTLLILVNVYNNCIAKQYFKLPRIYFWLWSKVTWNYILSHLWNADEIND